MNLIRTFPITAALLVLFLGLLVPTTWGLLRDQGGYQFETDNREALLGQTICLAGDTGKGNQKVHWLSVRMLRAGCTEIRILGDLIYPDGLAGAADPQYAEKFVQPFRSAIDAGLPFYVLQGNHDYNKGAPEAWLEIARRTPWLNYPALYYAEQRNGLCIVSIDSTQYEKLYRLPGRLAQNRWLAGVRADYQADCDFSLMLAHHPYLSPGRHGEALPQLRVFYEREVLGQFDLLITGHDHILSDVGQHQGTHLFISGVGSKVDQLKQDHPDIPYVEAQIGSIALSFHRENGALVAEASFKVLRGRGTEQRWQRRIAGQGWRGKNT